MYRRDQDRGRRPPKRSRSPDERDRSPREDKRRRPQVDERKSERSLSPRTTRSGATIQNGRDERHHRREERREKDQPPPIPRGPRAQGIQSHINVSKEVDERNRYVRDKRSITTTNSKSEKVDNKHIDRKLPPSPTKQEPPPTTVHSPSKPQIITSTTILEEDDPALSKMMGFSRFSSTKGKKHQDYGIVDEVKKRTYRQYMNRPGGFNRPIGT